MSGIVSPNCSRNERRRPSTLGERIVDARERRRLTQDQLARRIGVSRSAIAQWETDRATPSTPHLISLSETLSVSPNHLLPPPGQGAPTPALPATGSFQIRNLSVLAYANGFTLWHYKAAGAGVQAACAPGFFTDAADMLANGDVVMVSGIDGAAIRVVRRGGSGCPELLPVIG